MNSRIQNIAKAPLFLGILWVLFLGLSQMNMNMGAVDGKANCPFGGHPMEVCQMNPMEHIQEWQSMFTVTPSQNILLALFAFLCIRKLHFRFSIPEPPLTLLRDRLAYSKRFQIVDPLKEAFSGGILNPKVF